MSVTDNTTNGKPARRRADLLKAIRRYNGLVAGFSVQEREMLLHIAQSHPEARLTVPPPAKPRPPRVDIRREHATLKRAVDALSRSHDAIDRRLAIVEDGMPAVGGLVAQSKRLNRVEEALKTNGAGVHRIG